MSAPRSLAFVALLALAASCSSSTAPSSGSGCTGTNAGVSVCDYFFSPNASTITNGSTITWTWKGAAVHNVTFTGGPVAITGSANQSTGSFPVTFTTAGTYTYHCSNHPSTMQGTVTVN